MLYEVITGPRKDLRVRSVEFDLVLQVTVLTVPSDVEQCHVEFSLLWFYISSLVQGQLVKLRGPRRPHDHGQGLVRESITTDPVSVDEDTVCPDPPVKPATEARLNRRKGCDVREGWAPEATGMTMSEP